MSIESLSRYKDWFDGTAKVIYDPSRPGMKRKTERWCVANTDGEIARYFRWWVQKRYWIDNLCIPSWGAHISVTRGEFIQPRYRDNWKKFQNRKVKFKYTNYVKRTQENESNDGGYFWYVDVVSEDLDEIRRSLGLRIYPFYHITIGRTYY